MNHSPIVPTQYCTLEYLEYLAAFHGYTLVAIPTTHPNGTPRDLLPTIIPLLNNGDQWIQAIKWVREYTGWKLLPAKQFVDTYRKMNRAQRETLLDDVMDVGKCACGGCDGSCQIGHNDMGDI